VSDTSTEPQSSSATRDSIRQELEETRTEYHDLLNSLSPDDLKHKSGNPSWNVGQLMYHLAWAYGYVGQGVERSRKEKGFNPPSGVADFLNVWITRIGSSISNAEKLGAKYDEAHKKTLATLDSIAADEWSKGAETFGQFRTVEGTFRSMKTHLEEHRAHILQGLGRA
jgi:hypothetical protein